MRVNKIAEAFNKLYPNLNLHCGFALTAMQLEGLILKDVLLRGVRAGILALPIHDAVAVEFEHQDWAKDAMEDAWQSVMSEFHVPLLGTITRPPDFGRIESPADSRRSSPNDNNQTAMDSVQLLKLLWVPIPEYRISQRCSNLWKCDERRPRRTIWTVRC
jgi:hypothetical protein